VQIADVLAEEFGSMRDVKAITGEGPGRRGMHPSIGRSSLYNV
jgi:hypothetical protein